jgi:hypothetical protein
MRLISWQGTGSSGKRQSHVRSLKSFNISSDSQRSVCKGWLAHYLFPPKRKVFLGSVGWFLPSLTYSVWVGTETLSATALQVQVIQIYQNTDFICVIPMVWISASMKARRRYDAVAYWGGGGFKHPPTPRNSEGPPKSCQTQPDCENC